MPRSHGSCLAMLVLVLLQAGCGGKKVVPVKGLVTLDGNAVPGATVLFVPEEGSGGRQAAGLTDAEGYFQLTTYRQEDGALPGAYRVVVAKTQGRAAPTDSDPSSEKRMRERYERAVRPHPKRLLPARYSDPAATPFRVTVPAEDLVTLELSSAAKR